MKDYARMIKEYPARSCFPDAYIPMVFLPGEKMNFSHEILNVIHSTPESRISLAQKLQVTRPYITKLTAALLDKGVIEETEQKDSPIGRPRTILAVKKGMFFSVNVMVRQYTLEATLNDYNTTEKTSAAAMFTFNGPVSPDDFAAKVNELIDLMCQHAGVARRQVIHTGVALQGGIEQFSGVVRWCPALNEQHVQLKDRLLSACNTGVSVVNIAWCSCYMLNKALMLKESWLAFLPGFGSLGFGYFINGNPVLGDNGFYPEIVHLPYRGGLENAFVIDPRCPEESAARAVDALFFAIRCTAPLHNIKRVLLAGEFFDEAPDWVIPRTEQLLSQHDSEHINTIRITFLKLPFGQSMTGLIRLSSDAITALIA
ncbi:ROK family protein [Dickeya fangzhongdai]|uniref:ROK family protein n=1 Tax=Dickeya fangzhongdai TaxID=1778540 RepID=UPI001F0A7D33|nr:ROK family protein [Dickeya fangzhongdai]